MTKGRKFEWSYQVNFVSHPTEPVNYFNQTISIIVLAIYRMTTQYSLWLQVPNGIE